MALTAKDRVFRAAEMISFECTPTVSMVQAAAAVSSADADRYLKEWAEEQETAGGREAATSAVLLLEAERLPSVSGLQDSGLADEARSGTVSGQENRDLAEKISALEAGLKKISAEKDTAITVLAAQINRLESQNAATKTQLEQVRTAEQDALRETTKVGTELAATAARVETLQRAYDALLDRIGRKS